MPLMEFQLECDRNDVRDLDGGNALDINRQQHVELGASWTATDGTWSRDYPLGVIIDVSSSQQYPQPVLEVGKRYKITIEEVV